MSSVAPAPSGSRGELILQPSYFTSSLYVQALRNDIDTLTLAYSEQYASTQPAQPFTLFKTLWCYHGWKWIHFMTFDSRARETFLNVTLRLFLERMVKTEAPYIRAAALFGFYAFFYTQPLGTAPLLHSIANVSVPLDHYASLKAFPSSLTSAHLLPLQPTVSYILSRLLKDNVFFVSPHSELSPLNPRNLPREIFVEDEAVLPVDPKAPKKKGRPTKRDRAKKAKAALASLERWLEKTSQLPPVVDDSTSASVVETTHVLLTRAPATTLRQYQSQKTFLLNTIDPSHPYFDPESDGHTAVERANQFVLDRLKAAEELVFADGLLSTEGNQGVGLKRVENAVSELTAARTHGGSRGILGLLEGAGISQT